MTRNRSMIMRFVAVAMLLALLGGSAVSLYAQVPLNPPDEERRERIRQRFETMRVWKLTEALQLDTATSEKFFVLYNPYRATMDSLEFRKHTIYRTIHKCVRSENCPKPKHKHDYKVLLKELESIDKKVIELRYGMIRSVEGVLSDWQRAALIAFEESFERRIRESIHEMRGDRGRGHRRGGNSDEDDR